MAVRRSLGQGIADAALVKWLATQAKAAPVEDATTVRIEMALNPIVDELKFPKGEPHLVRRSRGRVVVERAGGADSGAQMAAVPVPPGVDLATLLHLDPPVP